MTAETPAPAPLAREPRTPGWYWVRFSESADPTPLQWDANGFWLFGDRARWQGPMHWVGPRIPSPGEIPAPPSALAERTAINCAVQARYDTLMAEGKHGHYETLFRIVHEQRAAALDGREAGWNEAIEAAAKLVDEQFNSPPVDSMNVQRLGGWEDCADHLRIVIRALAHPQPAGEAGDV